MKRRRFISSGVCCSIGISLPGLSRPWDVPNLAGPAIPEAVFLWGDSRGSGFVEAFVNIFNRSSPRQAKSGMSVWISGGRVRTMQPTVDDDIVALPAAVPHVGPVEYGLFALGANDLGDVRSAAISKADWTTAALYAIDAFRAKWPAIDVFCLRPWVRGYAAEADTYAVWVTDLIAARAFLHVGPDERICLENGDDGATYTTDGVHYSASGVAMMCGQWRSAIGI